MYFCGFLEHDDAAQFRVLVLDIVEGFVENVHGLSKVLATVLALLLPACRIKHQHTCFTALGNAPRRDAFRHKDSWLQTRKQVGSKTHPRTDFVKGEE